MDGQWHPEGRDYCYKKRIRNMMKRNQIIMCSFCLVFICECALAGGVQLSKVCDIESITRSATHEITIDAVQFYNTERGDFLTFVVRPLITYNYNCGGELWIASVAKCEATRLLEVGKGRDFGITRLSFQGNQIVQVVDDDKENKRDILLVDASGKNISTLDQVEGGMGINAEWLADGSGVLVERRNWKKVAERGIPSYWIYRHDGSKSQLDVSFDPMVSMSTNPVTKQVRLIKWNNMKKHDKSTVGAVVDLLP